MSAPIRPPFARLHIEPIGGVAGDMLLAALLDLGADLDAVQAAVSRMAEPGLALEVSRVDVDGVPALRVKSIPRAHHTHGRHLDEVLEIVDRAGLAPGPRGTVGRIFDVLAVAEAESHGATAHHVHLHEVGELDSILDVVGIAVAYHSLGAPPVDVAALPSGHGTVESAHGTLTLPAPAVMKVAARFDIPLHDVDVRGETVTPTGIAAVAALGRAQGLPVSRPGDACGVGAGTRRFPARPNVVRVHGYR
jgi:uncharacterized protein (DUF111 family)